MDGTTIKTTNCVGDTSYRHSAKIQNKGTIIGMAEKALLYSQTEWSKQGVRPGT
jgi:hypothetical protein